MGTGRKVHVTLPGAQWPPVWSCDISVGSRRQVAGVSVWLVPVASSVALSRLLVLLYLSFLISSNGHMGETVEL